MPALKPAGEKAWWITSAYEELNSKEDFEDKEKPGAQKMGKRAEMTKRQPGSWRTLRPRKSAS